jgi:hypothetical protein
MATRERVPMVRCRIGADFSGDDSVQRYVPLAEFGLWQYLMETRHRKQVTVDAISVWVPEEPALWNSGYSADELEPVLRVQFTVRGLHGALIPVERFFPALSYPQAQEALLTHYGRSVEAADVKATAGYFLPLTAAAVAPHTEVS